MAYNYNTFLRPLNDGDKNILIFNESGELVYTVNPFSVTNTQVRGNVITISVKSGRTILLDFLNSNFAKDALPILQSRIYTLTENTPNFIDKQLEQWISQNTTQRIGDFTSSPTLSFGTVSFTNVLPIETETWDVGSSEYKWNALWVKDAYIDNPNISFDQISGTPLFFNELNRWQNFESRDPNDNNNYVGYEFVLKDAHLYMDGKYGIRFTNFSGTESNKLFSAWDWDGPNGATPTSISQDEQTYNERAQISFKIEDGEKSSVSLKSFDWTGGSQSGLEHEYKFYEGDIIIAEGKGLYSGGLKFSSRITGTSNDLLTVATAGYYFEMTTQKYLSFERGISLIVSNGLEDFYVDD